MRVRSGARADQGAVAVFFALLVVGLLGFGAVVVDVGALYVEGRQLQNGAENSALAIAERCATSSAGCTSTASAAEKVIAGANALDGKTDIETICGTAAGLSGCSSSGERARFGCRPVTGSAPYVQVQTRSLTADESSNLLPGFLIKLFNNDYAGTEVRACARAAYGTPGGLAGELPLAISECEFNYWRNLYGLVQPSSSGVYPPAAEATLYFHDAGEKGPSNCPARNTANNMDSPGGFGWLTTNGDCQTSTTLDGDATEKQGNSVPNDCEAQEFAAMWKKIVHVNVYRTVTKDPATNKYVYDIVGYGAFYLSGYRLSGSPDYTRASPNLGVPCPSSSRCISGWFTTDPTATSGPLVAGPSYGTTGIKSTG